MQSNEPTAFAFGGFRLDLGHRRLVNPAGETVALPSRAFDVLACLVQNRFRVVSKDELMRTVWSRVVVEENNLNQAIYSIRKAFGDSRDTATHIVTVAGRGYQWVAETTAVPVSDQRLDIAPSAMQGPTTTTAGSQPDAPTGADPTGTPGPGTPTGAEPALADAAARTARSRRWLLTSGGAVAAVTAAGAWLWLRTNVERRGVPSSVAVLPFKPLTASDANEAVELGITETMINRLSELPSIVVAPLSSVRRYSDAATDPFEAGRTLGVAAVLDGSVQINRDRLRLTARLLDVGTGQSLWAGAFDEPLDDFFRVQESLANQVVRALSIELSGEERARLVRRDTLDPDAWQLYMNARYQWEQRTEAGFLKAISLYEAALQLDPRFALAYSGLADALAAMGVFNMRAPPSVFPRARESAQAAVRLDAGLAEAHASLGHVAVQYDRKWQDGLQWYRRALSLKPGLAQCYMWVANCHLMIGETQAALDEARAAQRLEPMSLAFAANVGMVLSFEGKYDAAYAQLSDLVDASPAAPLPRHHLARLYIFRGEAQKAVQLLEGYDKPAPGSLSDLGRAYALVGRRDAAFAQVERLDALGRLGFGVGYDMALILVALGELPQALAALESAIDDHSQMAGFVRCDPGFLPISGESRFMSVVERLGLN